MAGLSCGVSVCSVLVNLVVRYLSRRCDISVCLCVCLCVCTFVIAVDRLYLNDGGTQGTSSRS
eukprot:m.1642237 g.1642237  ORF g.1642237 m.1642237 type:complete len:63 (-) comp52068_c0_seq1:1-189(-)